MKLKLLVLTIFLSVVGGGHTQNFGTLSGTIRHSVSFYGDAMLFSLMGTTWMLYEGFSPNGYGGEFWDWTRDNHNSFLRFFNVGYDYLIPQWSISFSNDEVKLDQMATLGDNTFYDIFFSNHCYINYIGYGLNWKDAFSRFGLYCSVDYELRKYSLDFSSYSSRWQNHQYYQCFVKNQIQLLVPSVGLRYRLISPDKEIEGFPFNIVLEVGISYALVLDFKNNVYSSEKLNNYSNDALNNGFRSLLGIAITTNKFGSLYLRWTKDLYNLYNNDYIATDNKGYLYNKELKYLNKVKTSLSCFSIGWATFL